VVARGHCDRDRQVLSGRPQGPPHRSPSLHLPAPTSSRISFVRASGVRIAAEQSRGTLAPVGSEEVGMKAGAASPTAAARVRRAMARRPGVAGFALAPVAGTRPLRGVSPNGKGNRNPSKRSHHGGTPQCLPAVAEAQSAQSPDHPAARSNGRAAARLDQSDRHHSTARRRSRRTANSSSRPGPAALARRSQPASRPST